MKSFLKLTQWYFSRKALPYWSVLIIDCLCVLVAGVLAFAINHGGRATIDVFWTLFLLMLGCTVFFMIGFRIFHTYQGVIRYSSFTDLIRITLAVLIGLAILALVEAITGLGGHLVGIEVTDIVLTSLFIISFMWIIRVWVKTLYDDVLKRKRSVNVFIYGVKEGGIAIAKSINAQEESQYKVCGFVTNDQDLKNKHLMGQKVYSYDNRLPDEMKKHSADILMVSPLKMNYLQSDQDMLNTLIDRNIKIMVMPRAREWDGKTDLDVSEMRQVEPEDLLPRDKIEIDMSAAAEMISDKVLLITGAAGSIGSEIVKQVASFNPKTLILVDQAETPMHDLRLMMKERWPNVEALTIVGDIADKRIMERLFNLHKPHYVFHAAAYKHVPMMEDNPYEAVINNIYGTKVIADLAVKYGTKKFVMVSTDKAVNPTNVMGCSKRICEIYVQSLDAAIKNNEIDGSTAFVTTRFGNVLGSNGSVIPIFQEQIKKGGPVTVTHPDIIRFFMLIPEACKLVIEAGTMGKGGEIFVFDMGQPVKIADLAERMIKLSGAKNVKIKFTGLRDGEKLYEEVLNDQEKTLPTFHPKIKIAKVREYSFKEACKDLDKLVKDADILS
ncbi:MAG: polysaccharide biosynthesis protein, partial [Muribaculaceae bacterium]|nr:polysaccharide biosynthesis protein [Muribaculaceae bacterium]